MKKANNRDEKPGENLLIECAHAPKPGRSGGGLYTPDGLVAGICNFADPNSHVGLYRGPEAIRRFLLGRGMEFVYKNKPSPKPVTEEGEPVLQPAPELKSSALDQERRLAEVERKLDKILKALDNLDSGKAVQSSPGDQRPPKPR